MLIPLSDNALRDRRLLTNEDGLIPIATTTAAILVLPRQTLSPRRRRDPLIPTSLEVSPRSRIIRNT